MDGSLRTQHYLLELISEKKQHCCTCWEKPAHPRGWLKAGLSGTQYFQSTSSLLMLHHLQPVPWSPESESRSHSTSTRWMSPAFLALLWVYYWELAFPPLLPPVGDTLQVAGKQLLRKMGKMQNESYLGKYFQFYFSSPYHLFAEKIISFLSFMITTSPPKQNRKRGTAKLFLLTLYFIISRAYNWSMEAGVWYEDGMNSTLKDM